MPLGDLLSVSFYGHGNGGEVEKMAYLRKIISHGDNVERIEFHSARYKCPSRGKMPRRSMMPERAKRWQEKQLERKIWRLLDINFKAGDFWCTFTFRPQHRPKNAQICKEVIQKFRRALTRLYRRNGLELKFIAACGKGSKGGYHLHFVLNHYPNIEHLVNLWNYYANNGEDSTSCIKPLYASGKYRELAAYIVKNGSQQFSQVKSVFGRRVTTSRNLVMPKEKTVVVGKNTWRKNPPQKKGYFINKSLCYEGYDLYGYPYRYTVYTAITPRQNKKKEKGNWENERQ